MPIGHAPTRCRSTRCPRRGAPPLRPWPDSPSRLWPDPPELARRRRWSERRGAPRAGLVATACGAEGAPSLLCCRVVLVGREAECQRIDDLLASVRDGLSSTLVIRGEAG